MLEFPIPSFTLFVLKCSLWLYEEQFFEMGDLYNQLLTDKKNIFVQFVYSICTNIQGGTKEVSVVENLSCHDNFEIDKSGNMWNKSLGGHFARKKQVNQET